VFYSRTLVALYINSDVAMNEQILNFRYLSIARSLLVYKTTSARGSILDMRYRFSVRFWFIQMKRIVHGIKYNKNRVQLV
jgi:hypothetical protein